MYKNLQQNYLSVVAVLNKQSTISDLKAFIEMILVYCQMYFNDFELIFVDNNANKDVIIELSQHLNNTEYNANLVTLPYEQNKELGVLYGVDTAIGDFVFEFEDIKIDYTQKDLLLMYESCLCGNDIVFLRPKNKGPFIERLFYKLLTKYSNRNSILYKSRVHLISRRGINRVNSINKIINYRKYAYCNSGLEYEFVDCETYSNKGGGFSLSNIDYATDLLLIFTSVGKKVSIMFSMLFATISVISLIYTIIAYFTLNTIHGWATVMILLSISFTGIFISFSIVIKYLSLIIRNNYVDESTIASKRKI